MPSAMIVVVGIDDQEDAFGTVAGDLRDTTAFVGDPWPCTPTCDDDGYDTPGVLAQRAPADLGAILTERERVLVREGLHAFLEMHGAARLAFDGIEPLTYANELRQLVEKLT